MVDCLPSLNPLTINALAAADAVQSVPAVPVLRARRPVATFDDGRAGPPHPHQALTIHGVVLTMYDPRNSLAGQPLPDVRAYGRQTATVIPRNVRLSEAPSHRKASVALRSQVRGRPSLSQARFRSHSTRRTLARA